MPALDGWVSAAILWPWTMLLCLSLIYFWDISGLGKAEADVPMSPGSTDGSMSWGWWHLLAVAMQALGAFAQPAWHFCNPRVRSAELICALFSTVKRLLFLFFSPSWVGVFPSLLQQQNHENSGDLAAPNKIKLGVLLLATRLRSCSISSCILCFM